MNAICQAGQGVVAIIIQSTFESIFKFPCIINLMIDLHANYAIVHCASI